MGMGQTSQTVATVESTYSKDRDTGGAMIIIGTFFISIALYFCLELAFELPRTPGARTGVALFIASIAGLGLGINIFGIIQYVRSFAAK